MSSADIRYQIRRIEQEIADCNKKLSRLESDENECESLRTRLTNIYEHFMQVEYARKDRLALALTIPNSRIAKAFYHKMSDFISAEHVSAIKGFNVAGDKVYAKLLSISRDIEKECETKRRLNARLQELKTQLRCELAAEAARLAEAAETGQSL